ncbi:putative trna methyltransferase subunit [Diaporthe ampelina]|uniref:tRNA (adenine(58)-N(1))-methyltransferase catalytic subunit TRM61 n=1 Tax=Diaporthe ampelina TaxID=1214573 RepID=A0A0G2FS45_9PEZI|nr:putative trna methyltransferase subunit [Diaporthe ampelina]
MLRQDSPFLNPGPVARPNQLAIIQLSKDDLIPVYLRDTEGEHDGYKEGHVLNTRFGSFPHSTLIGAPWGSQVRASNVDTGSRGRKKKNKQPKETATNDKESETLNEDTTGLKRKRDTNDEVTEDPEDHFENDQKQLVLQVYDGETRSHDGTGPTGKVFSFEFHEQRFEKMRKEISEHGLGRMVEINHRDVYKDGFLVDGKSPEADAVFLDLPAPWLALPHLSRRRVKTGLEMMGIQTGAESNVEDGEKWISPLNPKRSAYICTFSPCIEQVTRTVSEMRKLGWVEIDMVEIAHKRINVYREKIGLDVVSDRGAQQAPGNVAEALAKLKEIEVKTAEHNAKMFAGHTKAKKTDEDDDMDDYAPPPEKTPAQGRAQQPTGAEEGSTKAPAVKPFLQGRLVTRPEAETKAHTSYLVFAVLPREWTEEDEAAAAARWPVGDEPPKTIGAMDRASRKAQRRELMQGNRKKNDKLKNSHVQKLDLTTEEAKSQAQEIEAEKVVEDAEPDKVKAEEA